MSNRIKEWRNERGLSQQALGDLVGTTGQQVGRLESGERRLSLDWIERFASALGCGPHELIGESFPVEKSRSEDLDELLGAVKRHWNALGTEYARQIFLGDFYRLFPALRMTPKKETKMVDAK